MALPKPAQRRVYRPRQRLSGGTKALIAGMLVLLAGSIAAFILIGLPMQRATLARSEASELAAARQGAAGVQQSLLSLWTELGTSVSMGLSPDRVDADLALAQKIELATDEASAHVHLAQNYLADLLRVPFQFRPGGYGVEDKAALSHLDQALQGAHGLAHAANLQLTIARHALKDRKVIGEQLDPRLRARAWTDAARTASDLQIDLAAQQETATNPESLLDPLWGKWLDSMAAYAYTAQQFALASATGQTRTVADLTPRLSATAAEIDATAAMALAGAASWHARTIQPLLDTLAGELGRAF